MDSLKKDILYPKNDTGTVKSFARLGEKYISSKPDSAMMLGVQGRLLAHKIKYTIGEAACMNLEGFVIGTMGNYPKALDTLLQALKLCDKIGEHRVTASVLNNIGIIYSKQGDHRQALNYILKAISLSQKLNDTRRTTIYLINSCDNYEALGMLDSALYNTQQGYDMARKSGDENQVGVALNNIGNIHMKMKLYPLAKEYYHSALPFYQKSEDREGMSEAMLGIARIFLLAGSTDSALYYAKHSLAMAQSEGFTEYILKASSFITDFYKKKLIIDSAFAYQQIVIAAKDSLFSQEKVQQITNLSFQEKLRQQEMDEAERVEIHTRVYNLTLILMALFIIMFALGVLLYARRKTKSTTVENLITLALLLVFEFIALLIHPGIEKLTNHNPILMLLILVCIGAILVPMETKLEHWIKHRNAHRLTIHPKEKKLKMRMEEEEEEGEE